MVNGHSEWRQTGGGFPRRAEIAGMIQGETGLAGKREAAGRVCGYVVSEGQALINSAMTAGTLGRPFSRQVATKVASA
ncbi:protein of unknown function [Serratia sp. Tan611]|nr:protein of unknown function [Serratia sp. Tan611]